MSKSSNKNPLFSPRTKDDFLARWPGATCTPFSYEAGLSVYVLRLEDGALVAVGANDVDIWEKGMALLEKGVAGAPCQKAPSARAQVVPVNRVLPVPQFPSLHTQAMAA
jgi:hypothetical protein